MESPRWRDAVPLACLWIWWALRASHAKKALFPFLFKKDLFIYFYVYEYTVAVQMVVSHHVVAGNWTQDLCLFQPCSLQPKDLFIIICNYTVAVFRHTREGVKSHYEWLWATTWLLRFELRTFRRVDSALTYWAISQALSLHSYTNHNHLPSGPMPLFPWRTGPSHINYYKENATQTCQRQYNGGIFSSEVPLPR